MNPRLAVILLGLLSVVIPAAAAAGKVDVIAHRGAASLAPENTLAAIKRGLEFTKLIEFDVQTSKDGRLVLMHDEKLARTTGAKGLVLERTFEELRQLDAGSKFGPQFAGEKIPEFEEAVNLIIAKGGTPLIDCKACSPHMLVAELRRLKLTERVLVNSADHKFLKEVNRLAPEITLSGTASVSLPEAELIQFTDRFRDAGAKILWWDHQRLVASSVKFFKRRGFKVYAWTVNSPEDMRKILSFGVDGIITDNPPALLAVMSAVSP